MSVELVNICKAYSGRQVFNNLSLKFDTGISCVMGASGCGKTTLLRIIAGLEAPDCGIVTGINKKRLSFMFQEDRLIPGLTVLENCILVKNDRQRAIDLLCVLGLKADLNKPAAKLSGGMARRTALARTLLYDADTVLLDEPLKGLDENNRFAALALIKQLTGGKTVIMVSHESSDVDYLNAVKITL